MKEKDFLKKVFDDKVASKEAIRQNAMNSPQERRTGGFNMKKRVAICTALVVVFVLTSLILMVSIYTPQKEGGTSPRAVNAYDKLFKVIEKYNQLSNSFSLDNINFDFGASKGAPMTSEESVNEAESAVQSDYSSTNVQTVGMDEGDIVKWDANYIYKINTKGCTIISAVSGNLEVVSKIEIENYVPQELYIRGNKIIMLGGIYVENYYSGSSSSVKPLYDCISYMSYSRTDIRIYDISNINEPVLERQLTLDGTFYTSRIMEETNKLFYMVNYYFSYGEEEDYIPKITDSTINEGAETKIPIENIYYYDDIANYSYLIIGQIDLDETQTNSLMSAYLGLGGEIYVSAENIYVATYDSMSIYETNLFGWVKENYDGKVKTRIVKIALADLSQKASARVDGTIKDRYSLDEYQGYLRVATTVNNSYSNIYVLKGDLTVAGIIENIAEGETIYSVKFNKEKGSLVTFRQMDPYFNLDLADPYNPKISKGLKEDGVSYYLHYIDGTDYTIGVGRMTEVINTPYGEQVRWLGLKISLYDNSSGEAVNIRTIIIGNDSCYSELFYNPKALLYDKDKGLFAFSYENWSYDYYYNYSSMEQGLAVFNFNLEAEDDQDKLIYKGTLTNLNAAVDLTDNRWDSYYYEYWSFISRGLRIGDYIYTVSDKYITSYDLATLTVIERLDMYNTVVIE